MEIHLLTDVEFEKELRRLWRQLINRSKISIEYLSLSDVKIRLSRWKKGQETIIKYILGGERQIRRSGELSKKLKWRIFLLRSLLDMIVWDLMNFDLARIKRLFHKHPTPVLIDSNIDSCIKACKTINSEPLSFGLIADATNILQTGDILYIDCTTFEKAFLELKDGKVNEQAIKAALSRKAISTTDPELVEQVARIKRQLKRGRRTMRLINQDRGPSPDTDGRYITNIQPLAVTRRYTSRVRRLFLRRAKGLSLDVINGCCLISLIDTRIYPCFDFLFEEWCAEKFIGRGENGKTPKLPFPMYDLRQAIGSPYQEPLFVRALTEKQIFDIVFGRLVLKSYIDYHEFVKVARIKGLTLKWQEKRGNSSSHNICLDHRPLYYMRRRTKYYLMNGMSTKIALDWWCPSAYIEVLHTQFN